MNGREKRLAFLVVAAIALWLGHRGFNAYQGAIGAASAEQVAAETALGEASQSLVRGMAARSRLNMWRAQSLPTDADVAKSHYQDWLKQAVTASGLQITEIHDRSNRSTGRDLAMIETKIVAQGALSQLVAFLQTFYGANHLHRVSRIDLAPTEDRQQVKIDLDIDGLILSDCPRVDALAEGRGPYSEELLVDAGRTLLARNLFAPYTPPTKSTEVALAGAVASGASNTWATNPEAALAQLTMVGKGSRGSYATVLESPSGRVRNYRTGQPMAFGSLQATVLRIDLDSRRLILSTAEGTFEVRLGQKFSEATAVDPPPIEA